MINRIKLNRRTFIRWKVYIDRARMYIGYINFLMIGIIFLKSIKDGMIGKFIFSYYYITFPVLFLLFIVLSLFVGYLDTRLGFREEEQRNISRSNPVMMEILQTVKDLKEQQEKDNEKHQKK